MEYLAILTFILFVFSLLKHKYRIRLFKSANEALAFFISCLIVGIAWDSFGILRGIGVLPIEEYLFITIVPFSVAVLYKLVTKERASRKRYLREDT